MLEETFIYNILHKSNETLKTENITNKKHEILQESLFKSWENTSLILLFKVQLHLTAIIELSYHNENFI